MSQARIGDLERRLCNIVHPGTIDEVDHKKARVRVKIGKNQTAWIPWMTGRAGGDRTWSAPEKGEQVLVLSPSGDLQQGYVLPAIYRKDYPANADSGDVSRTTYKDGAVVEYDRSSHTHNLTLPNSGTANIKVGADASVQVTKDTITHKMGTNASVEIKADGITLVLGSVKMILTSSGVEIQGDVTLKGKLDATKDITTQTKVTATGDITSSTGDVKATTISLKTHTHSAVQTGSGVSGPPVP